MVRNLGGHGWKKRLSVRSWRFREWRGLRNLLFARSGGRTGQRLDRLGLPADHGPGTVRGVEPEDVLYPGLEVLDQAGGPGVDLGRSIGEHALLLVRGRKWFGAEHLRGSARGNREAGTAPVSARRGKKQATRGVTMTSWQSARTPVINLAGARVLPHHSKHVPPAGGQSEMEALVQGAVESWHTGKGGGPTGPSIGDRLTRMAHGTHAPPFQWTAW